MLVFSCHADTNFKEHILKVKPDGSIWGHLDNFIGVQCVMRSYFSGGIASSGVRIELTYGEETDYAGAWEVFKTISETDYVIVIDVTATPTDADIVIEKCRNATLHKFMKKALKGLRFDIYDHCPDPQAWEDEVDVYSQKTPYCCFLGVPVWGGDYNEGPVRSHIRHIDAVSEAICRIVRAYSKKK